MDAELAELDVWLGTLEELQKSLHASHQIHTNRANPHFHSVSSSPNQSSSRVSVNSSLVKHPPTTPVNNIVQNDSAHLLPPLPTKSFRFPADSPSTRKFPLLSEQLSPELHRTADEKDVEPNVGDVITSSSRTSLFCASNSGTIARSPHYNPATDGVTQKRAGPPSISTTTEEIQASNGHRNRGYEKNPSLSPLSRMLKEIQFTASPEIKVVQTSSIADTESTPHEMRPNGADFFLPSPGSDEAFGHELASPFQSNLPPPSHALLFAGSAASSPNEISCRGTTDAAFSNPMATLDQVDSRVAVPVHSPILRASAEPQNDYNRASKPPPPPLPQHRNSSSGMSPNSPVVPDRDIITLKSPPSDTMKISSTRPTASSYAIRSKSVDLYNQSNTPDIDARLSAENENLSPPHKDQNPSTCDRTLPLTSSSMMRHHSLSGENVIGSDRSRKQVLVRIFQHDKSSKALAVDEFTTCREVCNLLIKKNNWSPTVSLSLVEKVPSLKMEHCFEDHEKLSECVFLWKKECENMLFFEERPDKYGFFHRPQMWLGENFDSALSAYSNIKETLFDEKETAPFEWKDYLYIKKPGEKSWNRKYCLIRNSSLYAAKKKKKTLLPNDVTRILSLTGDIRIYTTTGGWTKWKAPTPYGFSLKPICGENQCFKGVYLFSATDESALRYWILHLRLSKYGKQLLENYEKAQDDMTDLLQELESHHPNSIQLPPQAHLSNQWYSNPLKDEPSYVTPAAQRSTDSSSSGPSSPSSPASSHSPWTNPSPHPHHKSTVKNVMT